MNIQKLQNELSSIVNALVDAKGRLQAEVPVVEARLSERDAASKELIRAHDRFKRLLVDLDLIAPDPAPASTGNTLIDMKTDPGKIMIITCRNALKEKVDAFQNLIIDQVNTGGPLEAQYYKEINPNMPDSALSNIEKKIEKVFVQLLKMAQKKDLIFLLGIPDEKTDALLFKSKDLVASRTGKPVFVLEAESMQRLSEQDVLSLITRAMPDP